MPIHRYSFGTIRVLVHEADRGGYKVTVLRGPYRHTSTVAGDFSPGVAAAVALEDLAEAAADECAYLVAEIGEASGREALRRGKAAEKTIRVARRIGGEYLDLAVARAQRGVM